MLKVCFGHYKAFFFIIFQENKVWHFTWIVCLNIQMKCQALISKQKVHDGLISLTWANRFANLILKFHTCNLL